MGKAKGGIKNLLGHLIKKLNAPYRLTVSDAESMEESCSFLLTRKTVYIFLTSIFVGLFSLFSLIIFFTPLKYYVPGLQNNSHRKELFKLQNLSDSLTKLNNRRESYVYNLLKVVNGDFRTKPDTMPLSEQDIKAAGLMNENKIDKASRYEYLKNQRRDTLKAEKKDSLLTDKIE